MIEFAKHDNLNLLLDRVNNAVNFVFQYRNCDKQWIIDQMIRRLLSEFEYKQFKDKIRFYEGVTFPEWSEKIDPKF